jgi:hypothetical protein
MMLIRYNANRQIPSDDREILTNPMVCEWKLIFRELTMNRSTLSIQAFLEKPAAFQPPQTPLIQIPVDWGAQDNQ